jgi:hypothetical protein
MPRLSEIEEFRSIFDQVEMVIREYAIKKGQLSLRFASLKRYARAHLSGIRIRASVRYENFSPVGDLDSVWRPQNSQNKSL